jgi:FkbM family methyltransferase
MSSMLSLKRTSRLIFGRLFNLKQVNLHGVKVSTDPDVVPRRVRNLLFKQTYESAECELVLKHVKRGDRVLELGTGIGLVSLVATSQAGEGMVRSYEANPAVESLIRSNFALNGWTPDLRMQAITKNGDDIEFFQDPEILSSGTSGRDATLTKISIPSMAFAAVMSEWKPHALVIDIEGVETEILPGADLTGVKTVIVEIHSFLTGQDETTSMLNGLKEIGFKHVGGATKTWAFVRE